jgi:integrase
MAQVIKIVTTKVLPKDAETVLKGDSRFFVIRRAGKPVLCPLTPCGTKYRIESKKWYAQFVGIDGKVKRRPAFTDKSASLKLAEELEKRAAMRRMGCAGSSETLFELSMADLIDRFAKYLGSKNNTPDYCKMTVTRIRKLCDGANIRVWGQITPSTVLRWLSGEREKNAIGIRTSNYYLVAMKELCNWAVNESIALENPLRSAKAMNADGDVRRRRRAISAEEFSHLVEAARKGKPIQGMNGPERALLYVVAAWTGFRRSELASLMVSQLQLSGNEPTITVSAACSKRRRRDVIPLHLSVAAFVRAWLDQNPKAPGDRVFALSSSNGYVRRTSKTMANDLAAARTAWINGAKDDTERSRREASDFLAYESNDNIFADFHANRHTFITNLGKSGVSPKLAQTLARHSDIRLTFDVYTHVDQNEQTAAVSTLPSPPTQPCAIDFPPKGTLNPRDLDAPIKSTPDYASESGKLEGARAHAEIESAKTFALQFAQTHRGGCLSGATDDKCTPKSSRTGDEQKTNELPVICQ